MKEFWKHFLAAMLGTIIGRILWEIAEVTIEDYRGIKAEDLCGFCPGDEELDDGK